MNEKDFVNKIQSIGGKAYLVGGAVRDKVRNVTAHDNDYCVAGITETDFNASFPNAFKVGNSFPVYKVFIDDKFCEVAFARREIKIGKGYRGFKAVFDPTVKIEDDLYRRDTTINAIAMDLSNNSIIDPYNGVDDILNKKIRAVSKHFIEDPVRALRAARQSAQFNFDITDDTIIAMNQCSEELALEPSERIFKNLALQTNKPSIFFRSLERADLLKIIFPEIKQLIGKIQPTDFHPEGDAFEHTMNMVDKVATVNKNPIVRFSALVHDIGKGTTPESMLPHHYDHDKRGLTVFDEWNKRIKFPNDWKKAAKFIIKTHMRAPLLKKPGKIVDLLMQIHFNNLTYKDFNNIIFADHNSLPYYLEHSQQIVDELLKISGNDCPEGLTGKQIGDWIFTERIRKYLNIIKTQNI